MSRASPWDSKRVILQASRVLFCPGWRHWRQLMASGANGFQEQLTRPRTSRHRPVSLKQGHQCRCELAPAHALSLLTLERRHRRQNDAHQPLGSADNLREIIFEPNEQSNQRRAWSNKSPGPWIRQGWGPASRTDFALALKICSSATPTWSCIATHATCRISSAAPIATGSSRAAPNCGPPG